MVQRRDEENVWGCKERKMADPAPLMRQRRMLSTGSRGGRGQVRLIDAELLRRVFGRRCKWPSAKMMSRNSFVSIAFRGRMGSSPLRVAQEGYGHPNVPVLDGAERSGIAEQSRTANESIAALLPWAVNQRIEVEGLAPSGTAGREREIVRSPMEIREWQEPARRSARSLSLLQSRPLRPDSVSRLGRASRPD